MTHVGIQRHMMLSLFQGFPSLTTETKNRRLDHGMQPTKICTSFDHVITYTSPLKPTVLPYGAHRKCVLQLYLGLTYVVITF